MRQVNSAVGEVLITHEGREWYLRPSFFAMSKLGQPDAVVNKFKLVCDAFEFTVMGKYNSILALYPFAPFSIIRDVIEACMVEGDAHALTGHTLYYEGRGVRHKKGLLGYRDLVTIAFHLVKFGIAGKPKNKPKGGKPMRQFDASEYVGTAVAHLGLSTSDAWNLTMVEFQRAIEAKYPQDSIKDQQDISADEYNKLMAAHDEVLRKLNNG